MATAKRKATKKSSAKKTSARKPVAKKTTARKPAARKNQPAPAGANRIEGVKIMTKKNGVDAGLIAAEQFKNVFGDVNERAKTQIEKSTRVAEEMTELTKGNVEALVASTKVAAKGLETIGQEVAEFGRKSFEEASAAVRTFAEVRSATDFFRLQSEFAKTQVDSMVAESSKMSEAVIKLAGEVIEPITSRYSVAAERVKSLAA